MSDLISRSMALENYCSALCPKTKKGEYCKNCIVKSWLNNQPTAFDTEKVIAELESEKRYGSKYDSYYEENLYRGEMFENDVNNKTIDKAIDIVKKGGLE